MSGAKSASKKGSCTQLVAVYADVMYQSLDLWILLPVECLQSLHVCFFKPVCPQDKLQYRLFSDDGVSQTRLDSELCAISMSDYVYLQCVTSVSGCWNF